MNRNDNHDAVISDTVIFGEEEYGQGATYLTGDPDIDQMLWDCIKTLETKGAEYTGGSPDRLTNFRTAGAEIGIPMEKVLYTFVNKHWRAIQSYIKTGSVKSNESIQSRIMDVIVYMLLFSKMVKELEGNR